jgi:hypothetical protein
MADVKSETRREFGPEIPEQVMMVFALDEQRFAKSVTVSFDTERMAKVFPGIEAGDAESLAFLLWRSRVVFREAKVGWERAVESAWLRDELFKTSNDRRKARKAAADARYQRLQSLIQTGADASLSADAVEA